MSEHDTCAWHKIGQLCWEHDFNKSGADCFDTHARLQCEGCGVSFKACRMTDYNRQMRASPLSRIWGQLPEAVESEQKQASPLLTDEELVDLVYQQHVDLDHAADLNAAYAEKFAAWLEAWEAELASWGVIGFERTIIGKKAAELRQMAKE